MFKQPDYETARDKAGFGWRVSAGYLAYLHMSGVPIREHFLDPDACIEMYRKGRPAVRELFGDDVQLAGVATPHISYGHLNCLGCELIFPAGGEVAHTHVCPSLSAAVELLKRPVDFATAGMMPFYVKFRDRLREAFPDEPVHLAFSAEGPLTSAYGLRGHDVFMDVYDHPEAFDEFLTLLTDSIVAYKQFLAESGGGPKVNPDAGYMVDDLSSLLSPAMFPRFVAPHWNRYFDGLTSGYRYAHVESLQAGHVKYLEAVGLAHFDPSISPKLNPKIIAGECRVPFDWRLGSFHYRDLSCRDVRDWVFQAAADGASSVSTDIEGAMCEARVVPKVRAFIEAAKEAERMFRDGATREDLAANVSPAGRERFWDHWPE